MKITVTATVPPGFLSVDGPSLVRRVGQRVAERAAEATLAAAQPRVPVDTETLVGSGSVEPTDTGARVGFDADYAGYVHGPMDGSAPGTTPHWPPFGPGTPLADWADRHGIPAFLVARHIGDYGTKQVPFLTDAKNEVVDGVLAGLKQDALDELRQALRSGGGGE